jgi:hypothetical protein
MSSVRDPGIAGIPECLLKPIVAGRAALVNETMADQAVWTWLGLVAFRNHAS